MSVQILRSVGGHPYLIDTANGRLVLQVHTAGTAPVPWSGARTLLALLRRQFGTTVVEEALARQRPRLSLVLRGLETKLTSEERERAALASANFRGSIPNLFLRWESIAEAWADCIFCVLHGIDATIAFPDAVRLDAESIGLIRPLLRRSGLAGRLQFLVGIDSSWRPQSLYERVRLAVLDQECGALAALTCTDEVTTSNVAPIIEPCPVYDLLDDQLEESAWNNPTAIDLNVRAARAAYGAYGLAEGLAFAGRVLEINPEGRHAAEMHMIVGVCARNLRIGEVREVMADLSRRHFEEALAREQGPPRKASLLCWVAVNRSSSSSEYAERAVEYSRHGPSDEVSAFYEAWALNARALCFYKAKRFDEASADCEQAIGILRANLGRLALPTSEVLLTIWLLYENLTRVALESGRREHAVRYQALAAECASQMEPEDRPGWSALAAQTVTDGLAEGVLQCEERLQEAQEMLSPFYEALWQHTLGQLYYRQGVADRALGAFHRSLEIWRRIGAEYVDVTSQILNSALAALRAGRGEQADAYLTELLTREGMDSSDVAVEILAARGLAAFLRSDEDLGGAMLSEAKARASDMGDAALLARVLIYSARAADLAGPEGRHEWERAQQAIEAAGGPNQVGVGVAAIAEIALLTAESAMEPVWNAVNLTAAALDEGDLEVWWSLPDLEEKMARHCPPHEGPDTAAWSRVLTAAKDRSTARSGRSGDDAAQKVELAADDILSRPFEVGTAI